MAKKKKIKIPKSVLDLRLSPKQFAKKHDIRLKGKGLKKSDKKHAMKQLEKRYAENAIRGMNQAVKILAENKSEGKKIEKVKSGVENIILNSSVMKKIAKMYKKNPDDYSNMIFLPNMIMNTIQYYNQDDLSDDDKEIAATIDSEALIEFCEKILKDKIKRYKKSGLSPELAYHFATVVPTTKILKNRDWYKKLIQSLYAVAGEYDIDVNQIMHAIIKIDKKKGIKKNEFAENFYSEFIMTKLSNKNHSFNDSQKELHETLIEMSLSYLDTIKKSKCRDILKTYIKRRKTAESYKNDGKRVIKFVDYANSNSVYTNLKTVLTDLIADNSANEIYLG